MGLWNCGLSLIDFVAFCKPLWPLLHATCQCGFCWSSTCCFQCYAFGIAHVVGIAHAMPLLPQLSYTWIAVLDFLHTHALMVDLGWLLFFLAVPFPLFVKTAAPFKNISLHRCCQWKLWIDNGSSCFDDYFNNGHEWLFVTLFLVLFRPNNGFCNPWLQLLFLLPPLLWSPVAWFFLGGLVTSAGLGKGNLATSSQMVNDFPQGFWLHGNKQIPLGWSLATNQTWNLSGTQ